MTSNITHDKDIQSNQIRNSEPMKLKSLSRAIASLGLVTLLGTAQAAVIINDSFNDGNLSTNAGGVGSGFDNAGQFAASESGGNAVVGTVSPFIYSTSVITS